MPVLGSAFQPVQEIEDWIKANTQRSQPGYFKIQNVGHTWQEVAGHNWGAFGHFKAIVGARIEWRVTHILTGKLCGPTFSSEKSASRYCAAICNLIDWREHNLVSMDLINTLPVQELSKYCRGGVLTPAEKTRVLKHISQYEMAKPKVKKTRKERTVSKRGVKPEPSLQEKPAEYSPKPRIVSGPVKFGTRL